MPERLTILGCLDDSLKELLRLGIPLDEDKIHFDIAAEQSPTPDKAVNLFLYDVRENRDLRSNEWQVERRSGMVTKQPPPVRVDCSYLITASAGDTQSEHDLLGLVMETLLRYPTLPDAILQGKLANQPLPTSSLGSGKLQSVGEYWQTIGGKPKATLHYTVTLSVQAQEPIEVGPPVTEVTVRFGPPTQEE